MFCHNLEQDIEFSHILPLLQSPLIFPIIHTTLIAAEVAKKSSEDYPGEKGGPYSSLLL